MKKKFISFSNKRSKPILVLFALTLLIIFGFQISDLKALSYFGKDGELYAEGLIEGTKSGKALVLPNATYVGIGTGSPSALLHLEQQSGELVLRLKNNAGRNWEINSKPTSGGNGIFSIVDRTANADRFVINASGNVGIGVTNPTSKLHVDGTIYTPGTVSAQKFSGTSIELGLSYAPILYASASNVVIGPQIESTSGMLSWAGITAWGTISTVGGTKNWSSCYDLTLTSGSCTQVYTLTCEQGYFLAGIRNDGGSNTCFKQIRCCSLGSF